MAAKAEVFDVKHYAVHDGPGIRTTFFLIGCPLRCKWCQNPESWETGKVITFSPLLCISCGKCRSVCNRIGEDLLIGKKDCDLCGNCVKACPAGARKFGSSTYTPEQVLGVALPEKIFFDRSGGGVTFSGGECLMHQEFMENSLKLLKENGIRTAVDTCGAVPEETFARVLPYTDLFLYDIKKIDSGLHKEYTGVDNGQILENLKYLCKKRAAVIIRVPLIPGMTDSREDIEAIGSFLNKELSNHVIRIELLPYNRLAASKYGNKTIWTESGPGEYPLPEMEPQSNGYLAELSKILEKNGCTVFLEH